MIEYIKLPAEQLLHEDMPLFGATVPPWQLCSLSSPGQYLPIYEFLTRKLPLLHSFQPIPHTKLSYFPELHDKTGCMNTI